MPELSLAELRQRGLPAAEVVSGRLGYLHDFLLGFDYELVDELPDAAGDLVVIADNRAPAAKLRRLAEHDGGVVLALAGSDAPFRPELLPNGRVLPANLVAAYTINNEVCDGRVTNLPLGIRILNREHCLAAAGQRTGPPQELLYANFSVTWLYGRDHVRHRLAARFEQTEWVETNISRRARRSERELLAYYESISRHKFVLSPEGIGPDCYRHWECLYLGAIPIVRASPAMSSFADLPILFTEDYSEVEEGYLEEQWARFAERRFEVERLTASFYRERFRRSVSRLHNPRFLCWGFRGSEDEAFLDRLAQPG